MGLGKRASSLALDCRRVSKFNPAWPHDPNRHILKILYDENRVFIAIFEKKAAMSEHKVEKNIRLEVMEAIEPKVDGYMKDFLIPIDEIWQSTDLLPDSQSEGFMDAVEELRGHSAELGYDFWVTLVADTITEEALPTYESWLMDVEIGRASCRERVCHRV